eukprot:1548640-Pleurochrysis_carterae.AAC.1
MLGPPSTRTATCSMPAVFSSTVVRASTISCESADAPSPKCGISVVKLSGPVVALARPAMWYGCVGENDDPYEYEPEPANGTSS